MPRVKARITPATEALLVGIGVALVYYLLRSSPFVAAGAFSDDGIYLALGKALAEGEGYRSLYAVGEPVHQKYPPGLPGVHALLWWLGGSLDRVYPVALLLSLAVTSCAAGLLWWVARRRLALGIPVSLFFVVGPFFLEGSIQYFNLALSEPWFMALWAGALVLFPRASGSASPDTRDGDRPPDEPAGSLHPPRDHLPGGIGLGLVVAAAVLFRTQAIVLVPAILLGFLVARTGWKAPVAFSACALIPVLLWRTWHARMVSRGPVGTQPDEEAYIGWMPEGGVAEVPGLLVELISYQLASYGTFMPAHLTGFRPLGILVWIVLFGLVLKGALRLWRRHPDLALGCAASLAIILLWPWSQDRFLLTILPFLGLLAGSEVERWQRSGAMTRRGVGTALCLLALVVGARQFEIRAVPAAELGEMQLAFHPAHFLESTTRYTLAASSWVLENTDPHETLLAPQPSGIWLHTDRKVISSSPALPHVGPSIWHEPGRFLAERLVEDRPDFVVLAGLLYDITRDIAKVQEICPQALEHLGASDRFGAVILFRVRYDDPCLQDQVLEPTRRRLAD